MGLTLYTESPRREILGNWELPLNKVLGNSHSLGPVGVTAYAADLSYSRKPPQAVSESGARRPTRARLGWIHHHKARHGRGVQTAIHIHQSSVRETPPGLSLFTYPFCSSVGSLRGLPQEACDYRSLLAREAFLDTLYILDVGPQVTDRLLKPRLRDEHQRAPTILGVWDTLDVPPRLQPVDHGCNGSWTDRESLTQTLLSHGPRILEVLERRKFRGF